MTEIFTEDSVETAMLLSISKSPFFSVLFILFTWTTVLYLNMKFLFHGLCFYFKGKVWIILLNFFLVDLVHFLSLAY